MISKIEAAAKRRGAERTAHVEVKVREAMEVIERKMAENGGIYPNNGGAVSMNEVARIAKISQTTLFSPKQKALGQAVKAWVESLKERKVIGRIRVRRSIQERADDLRKKYIDLQNAFVITELELQDTKAMLEEVQEALSKLCVDNAALLRQLNQTKNPKVMQLKKIDID